MVRDPEELVPHGKEAFAGNAADVHAGAPDRAAVDHQRLRSVSIRANRCAEGGGTAAKDDEIVSRRHGLTPS